ncbi:transcriptional activator-like protein 7 [Elsinoe australis]|uniref:Transcriptional activator-like protein 7 n=1 Tax=Elsinoe australis TaxID=40998 RepID=A0A4U7B0X5_9PEZI|nr:transcriptional activator-like protein 7 [Elsinoe australis]
MPSTKRLSDAHDGTPPATKVQRTESADFSGAVKKKLSGASRTGQACDRCKVRKIRCDARPGGCSPCAQNNTECRTTDRITGRATSRGYTENVETENQALKQHLADLRRQLQEHGIEPRAQPLFRDSFSEDPSPPSSVTNPNDPHNLSRILNPEPPNTKGRSRSAVLPDYQPDSVGDNYLGVASANDWPSPVGGMHHALFGMHLDLKDFVGNDDSELYTATTYSNFLTYISVKHVVNAPAMPPYHQCRTMFDWFFKMPGSWLPVLHKPHVMALLDRVYHDPTYTATVAETVQLHLVLACMLYQYAVRNPVAAEFNWSDHYRYALSFFIDIYRENSLPALQALAMVVLVMRAFPKPGAVWIVSVSVVGKAVEMGLHRSVNAWQTSETKLDPHDIEMRKRVFWSILLPHITVGARLGRPFMVRLEDFDVELPEVINDNLPDEEDLPEHRKCSFLPGVNAFKFLVVQLQMYSSLYTIRPVRHSYEDVQKKLSKEIDVWFQSMPPELTGTEHTSLEDRGYKIYMDFGHQNLRLLLYHPSLLPKPDAELMSRNLDVCLDASSKLLVIAQEMRQYQILDTTWFNSSFFMAAMFTTLFAYSERKDRISSAEFKQLKSEMDQWIDIMGDIGQLLGSGTRLPNALRQITSAVINDISRHIAAKTASAAFATASSNGSEPTESTQRPPKINATTNAAAAQRPMNANPHVSAFNMPYSNDAETSQAPFLPSSATAPFPTQQSFYPDPASSIPPYTESLYPDSYEQDLKPDMSALAQQHSAALASQTAAHQQAVHQQAAQNHNFYGYPNGNAGMNTGTVAWRNFADNMANSISHPGSAQAHWSANALMSLQQNSPAVKNSPSNGSIPPQPGVMGHAQHGGANGAVMNGAGVNGHGVAHQNGHVAASGGHPSMAAHSSGVSTTAGGTAGLGEGVGLYEGMGNGMPNGGMGGAMGAMGNGMSAMSAWPNMGLYAGGGGQ